VFPLLTEADIERIVFDSPSHVIDVGVRERFFTGALRRALIARDRHCQHPCGCDVPAEECQGDHEIPYSEGGLTTQENGRMYCGPHNRGRVNDPNERPPPDDE
jgi:5-methylcytosine-specific restriction endonuclease McrA